MLSRSSSSLRPARRAGGAIVAPGGDPMDRYDLLVIGGGAAGINAVRAATRAGAHVALGDMGPLGGTCVNRGGIPKKALVKARRVHSLVRHAAQYGTGADNVRLDRPRRL